MVLLVGPARAQRAGGRRPPDRGELGLGVHVGRGETTIHDLFRRRGTPLASTLRGTTEPNLFLAPADPLFEHGSGLLVRDTLAEALGAELIQRRFDVIVLDTPPSLDALLISALSLAHGILIPYVPHHLSLEGVKQLMRVLFKVKTGVNPGLKILGFLPVMVSEHIRQHRAVIGEITHLFGAARLFPGIRNDIRLVESFGAGRPIRTFAPRTRAAEDFRQLGLALAPALILPLTPEGPHDETTVQTGGSG